MSSQDNSKKDFSSITGLAQEKAEIFVTVLEAVGCFHCILFKMKTWRH
jgi:hypothetical protein